MNILIVGGSGFIGSQLAKMLLDQRTLHRAGVCHVVDKLLLLDREKPLGWKDPRVVTLEGDIADAEVLATAIRPDIDVVFHLAAVVSSEAEADFDLGMRVNIDGSRKLLEACRGAGHRPRVIFTSSVAVFGPNKDYPKIDDRTAVDPRSSYGMEKAVAELLLKDYTRRGFVDGVVLRLPTISVRQGLSNRAASSFASGIVREPLAGMKAICPVAPDTRLWLLSPRAAIANLVHAAQLEFPRTDQGRVINLPGVSVTVADMVAALGRIAGPAASARVRWERDNRVEAIVASWPTGWDVSTAHRLGFVGDESFEAMIRAYIADELKTDARRINDE